MKWKRGKKAQQEARIAAQQQLKQQQQQQLNASSTSTGITRLTPVPLMLTNRPSYAPASGQAQFGIQEASSIPLSHPPQQSVPISEGAHTDGPTSPAHSPASSTKSSSSSSLKSSKSSTLSKHSMVSSHNSRVNSGTSPPPVAPSLIPAQSGQVAWQCGENESLPSGSKLSQTELQTPKTFRDEPSLSSSSASSAMSSSSLLREETVDVVESNSSSKRR